MTRRAPGYGFKAFLHILMLVCGFFLANSVLAEEAGSTNCNFDKFGAALAGRESGGDYSSVNSYGYLGKYQFGTETLHDLGFYNGPTSAKNQDWSGAWDGPLANQFNVHSMQDFLGNQAAQDYAFQQNQSYLWSQIKSKGLDQYVGQTINGVTITESGLLAGCHLKGCGGLSKCLNGTGSCTDGYNTSVFEYLQKFGGYNTPWGGGGDCKPYANTASPRSQTYGNPMCDERIRAQILNTIQAGTQMMTDFKTTNATMPRPLSEVANTPCASRELQRITNKFASAPSMYAASTVGQLQSLAGPVSGLMNNMFKSLSTSFTSAANMNPLSQQFNNFASNQLGSLMSSLGLDGPFSSALCGMMVDMVLKYVQCQYPIQLPSLGSLTGSLNKLLGNGCAGQALTSTLYAASSSTALKSFTQPITVPTGGLFSSKPATLGTASGYSDMNTSK